MARAMSAPRREAASAYVWVLVSGLPGEKRRRRQLLMLQAHIDDSKTDSQLFVLGGFIAPAEAWAAFTEEWQKELDQPPQIPEFKMTMMHRNPEWRLRFQRIVEKYAIAALSVTIPLPALEAALRDQR
jgi:hypothetical protein